MTLSSGPPRRVDGNDKEFSHSGPVHAVAGIARPERFFSALKAAGINAIEHPFPDHHPFRAVDLDFDDELPVLMTEKDAVKCRKFANPAHWMVPATAEPGEYFDQQLLELLGVSSTE